MAEDKEDEIANNQTRTKILALQSENSRKRETYARLKEKKGALDDELTERREDESSLKLELEKEGRKQKENQENRHSDNLQDEAVSKFIENEVRNLLASRIPAFQADAEENLDDDEDEENREEVPDDQTKKVHDSVVVTYVAPNPQEKNSLHEYRVTYRVDKFTTGVLLHADACEYWGCSKGEFKLCKPDPPTSSGPGGEPKEFTPEMMQKPICDEKILEPKFRAHLILLHEKVLTDRKDMLKKANLDLEEIIKKQQSQETGGGADELTSIKHGGKAQAKEEEDHFAVAFQKFPGIHNLFKYSPKHQPVKNWHRIKCRDVFIYMLLALCSGITINARYPTDYYWLRRGVLESVSIGIQSQTSSSTEGIVNINNVKRYEDVWNWVRGSFHYQIFNGNSTLREFYVPMGILRVRQQKAAILNDCRRIEVELIHRGGDCHDIGSQGDAEDKRIMIVPVHSWINTSAVEEDSGRLAVPDPLKWVGDEIFNTYLTGYMQSGYSGSGYMVDYNLTAPNVATTFLDDMEIFKKVWTDSHTRLLTFEVLIANYNLGGFIASTFMFEFAPSGAVHATSHLLPTNIGETVGGGGGAAGFDAIRAVVVLYIMTIQVISETKCRAAVGMSGLTYVWSFIGFIDLSTVALFIAMSYMRLKSGPPDPAGLTQFYSWSFDATVHERLFCTEGLFVLLVMIRFVSFMKLSANIDKFWKTISRACLMIGFWLFIFAPLFLGIVMFAHCIWSPYVRRFSTWWETIAALVFFIKQDFPIEEIWKAQKTWTIPFVIYYYVVMILFLLNGFLALSVHAYWQVQVTDVAKEGKAWNTDQWMDWILVGPLYRIIFRRAPGASKRDEGADDEGGEDEEDDDEDDDKDE